MTSKAQEMKKQLTELVSKGWLIYYGLAYLYCEPPQKKEIDKIGKLDFVSNYEKWYSEALEVVKQLLPERLSDFTAYYKLEKRKEIDFLTYTISDALIGLVTSRGGEEKCNSGSALVKFQGQVNILQAVQIKFDSLLFNLKNTVQADLFDSELDGAKLLNKNGYCRGAGAIAGVILEKHLQELCIVHKLKITKGQPTINDLNQSLKDNNIIEVKDWRYIQHLADIRNLCDHKKTKDPSKEDVEDLISGVSKVIRTLA